MTSLGRRRQESLPKLSQGSRDVHSPGGRQLVGESCVCSGYQGCSDLKPTLSPNPRRQFAEIAGCLPALRCYSRHPYDLRQLSSEAEVNVQSRRVDSVSPLYLLSHPIHVPIPGRCRVKSSHLWRASPPWTPQTATLSSASCAMGNMSTRACWIVTTTSVPAACGVEPSMAVYPARFVGEEWVLGWDSGLGQSQTQLESLRY